jgi:DNA-binding IclR family transcriptional regulator
MVKVTKSRSEILKVVADMRRASGTEIAEAMGRNRGTIYKMLQELVAGGLLDRDQDDYVLPDD